MTGTDPRRSTSGPAPTPVVLGRPPALAPLLLRGALRSPLRRPHPDAPCPRTRLVLPSVRADTARLAAYRSICGFPEDGTLPVTYPHVLGFPLAMRLMSGRDFPLPLLGLVHTSIGITRHAALPATDAYELAVHVAGLAPHRRGTEATVVTELRADGTVVWESASTYLARHRTPDGAAPAAGGSGAHSAARTPLPEVDRWTLPGDLGRRYGAASGDRNPIHLHPLTARLFGFPRAIAHGMWTAARCLAAQGTPEAADVRVEFKAPVLLPGTVVHAADGTGRFALRSADASRTHLVGEVRELSV
jgi:acyl dehydratase